MTATKKLKLPWTSKGDDSNWSTPSRDNTAVSGCAAIFDASGEVVAFAVNVGWNDKDSERRDAIIKAVNAIQPGR